MWQDYMITAIQWCFALALIPAIVGPHKPAWHTCAMTGGLLYLLAVPFASLGLWWSVASTITVAVAWTVLLVQSWKRTTP